MKKNKRTLAIILCLVLLLSITVFADWEQYQKDGSHNGVIPSTEAPYTTSGTLGTHLDEIQLGSGGWSGIDTEPLMLTEDGTTYAYVTYNGGAVSGNNGGTRLAKIDCSSPNSDFLDENNNYDPQLRIIWSIQLTQSSAFQLSTPCYYNGKIYVAGNGLSQLLQNNELTKSGGAYPHWSINGGSQNDGYVTITGNTTVTFTTTTPVNITGGYNHRPAMGIRLGATSPSSTEATIDVYATPNGGSEVSLGSFVFEPNAASSNRPIKDENDIYWYYLNHNLTTTNNNKLTTGSYTFRYVVSMSGNSGNSVDVEYCSFYEQNSTLFEISSISGTTQPSSEAIATLGTNGGQINTPITAYDCTINNGTHKCIFFGTYNGTKSYYQYDLTTNTLKTFNPGFTTTGYYWAGAFSDGTSVAFGSDNGYLCYTTADNFGTTKKEYSLNTLGSITDAGNVRSSLCKCGDYVYFTSQGGSGTSYIWKIYWPHIASLDNPQAGDVSKIQLSGGSSTSTPVVSSNGYIYVGTYGSSDYTNNGVRAIDVNYFDASHMYEIVSGTGSYSTGGTNCVVQCSIIVYSPDTTADYVFYTTNQAGGSGYCVKHLLSDHSVTNIWNTGSGNFTLQGMSAANGYLTFGNDGHKFYVIKP